MPWGRAVGLCGGDVKTAISSLRRGELKHMVNPNAATDGIPTLFFFPELTGFGSLVRFVGFISFGLVWICLFVWFDLFVLVCLDLFVWFGLVFVQSFAYVSIVSLFGDVVLSFWLFCKLQNCLN